MCQNSLVKNLKPIPSQEDTFLDDKKTAAQIIAARTSANISQKTLSMEMGFRRATFAIWRERAAGHS